MKIVCISASRVPSDAANSIQVMKVCQAFAQLGHEVVLRVPGQRPAAVDDRQLVRRYGLRTPFEIQWLPTPSRRLFAWSAVRGGRGADLLYTWPVQAAALGLLSGRPVMLEMHDFPTGLFGPSWYRLFLRLPGKKRLLPITAALRHGLEGRYRPRLPDDQVVISPNGVDLERYTDLPDPVTARRQLGLPSALTVACTGHLYAGRGADLFAALAKAKPQVNFFWIGGRPEEVEEWKHHAASLGLNNLVFTGFVSNEELPRYQSAADVLLMPYGRHIGISSGTGHSAEISSPLKMFEYMAAGRAILASDLPVLREVLNEGNAVFCPPEDAAAWEFALEGLLDDEKRRQALGLRARRDVERYSWIERARRALQGFRA